MKYSQLTRTLAKAVLETWRRGEFSKTPNDPNFVSCRHCGEAGARVVVHADDCPVRISRKILRGEK